MAFTKFHPVSHMIYDPALAPTKAIQNIQALDNSHWQQQPRTRFDTTYRTEFINRIRHPDSSIKAKPISNSSLNQYSVLPPISNVNNQSRTLNSARSAQTDLPSSIKNSDVPNNELRPNDIPPLNLNNGTQNPYQQQYQPPPPPPPPPMMKIEDTYLPEEPVLLTDYEEDRLAEQIRTQLGSSTTVEKLKLFYQELAAYDPNMISYVHYSNIQLVASQIGLNLQADTFRFAMCKFVSPERGRGYVNYEDLIRYFGKCLSSISANTYGHTKSSNLYGYHQTECPCRYEHNPYFRHPCPIHHPYP